MSSIKLIEQIQGVLSIKLMLAIATSLETTAATSVVGKGGFWRISPYTWLKLFNYIQINHIRGWNTDIIRVPTIHMVGHNLDFTECG